MADKAEEGDDGNVDVTKELRPINLDSSQYSWLKLVLG